MATQDTAVRRLATSPAVLAKARQLPVRYDGGGVFTVGSGTHIGLVYEVRAPFDALDDLAAWRCTCDWRGAGCSHVRAAQRWARREIAKKAKVAA